MNAALAEVSQSASSKRHELHDELRQVDTQLSELKIQAARDGLPIYQLPAWGGLAGQRDLLLEFLRGI